MLVQLRNFIEIQTNRYSSSRCYQKNVHACSRCFRS